MVPKASFYSPSDFRNCKQDFSYLSLLLLASIPYLPSYARKQDWDHTSYPYLAPNYLSILVKVGYSLSEESNKTWDYPKERKILHQERFQVTSILDFYCALWGALADFPRFLYYSIPNLIPGEYFNFVIALVPGAWS